jgi:hypothetical protein
VSNTLQSQEEVTTVVDEHASAMLDIGPNWNLNKHKRESAGGEPQSTSSTSRPSSRKQSRRQSAQANNKVEVLEPIPQSETSSSTQNILG